MVESELKQGLLVEVLTDISPAGMAFHALYPASGKLSFKLQQFVEMLDKVLLGRV